VDISEVMAEIEALLNQSIAADDYELPPVGDPSRYIDLSQIDFESLREKFEGSRKAIEVQKLRAKLTFKLARMIQVNRTRIDFLEEFQKMIDEYNNGAINVQVFFDKLLVFARRLDAEEKRGLAEQLTEEELVIFDLLTKPDVVLTSQEAAEVKKVARSLLEKLKKEKLVLDWRKQQTTRAMVLTTIKDVLDELPRAYTKELYEQKCDTVYQHFYEAYMGQGKSAYEVRE
jgi:type I restriction enzyme R subunit